MGVLWCQVHVRDESRQFCKADVECHCDKPNDSCWSSGLDMLVLAGLGWSYFPAVLSAVWVPKSQAAVQCDLSPVG